MLLVVAQQKSLARMERQKLLEIRRVSSAGEGLLAPNQRTRTSAAQSVAAHVTLRQPASKEADATLDNTLSSPARAELELTPSPSLFAVVPSPFLPTYAVRHGC